MIFYALDYSGFSLNSDQEVIEIIEKYAELRKEDYISDDCYSEIVEAITNLQIKNLKSESRLYNMERNFFSYFYNIVKEYDKLIGLHIVTGKQFEEKMCVLYNNHLSSDKIDYSIEIDVCNYIKSYYEIYTSKYIDKNQFDLKVKTLLFEGPLNIEKNKISSASEIIALYNDGIINYNQCNHILNTILNYCEYLGDIKERVIILKKYSSMLENNIISSKAFMYKTGIIVFSSFFINLCNYISQEIEKIQSLEGYFKLYKEEKIDSAIYDKKVHSLGFFISPNADLNDLIVSYISIHFNPIIDYSSGTVYFGSYPQSIIKDETLISELCKKVPNLPTADNSYNWTCGGTYGMPRKDNKVKEYYFDVDINDDGVAEYRGICFLKYSENGNTHLKKNETFASKITWFLYEPIQWIILGHDTLLSKKIIDCRCWHDNFSYYGYNNNGFYENNRRYSKSAINHWLNDQFINTIYGAIFNKLTRLKVKRLSLLSKEEALQIEKAVSTDYANRLKSNPIIESSSSYWWSNTSYVPENALESYYKNIPQWTYDDSPNSKSNYNFKDFYSIYAINNCGKALKKEAYIFLGVRPSLQLEVKVDVFGSIISLICDENNKS